MNIYLEATKKPDGDIRVISYTVDNKCILIDNIVEAESVPMAVLVMVDLYDRNTNFKAKVEKGFQESIQSKDHPNLYYIESDELDIYDLCEIACGEMM